MLCDVNFFISIFIGLNYIFSIRKFDFCFEKKEEGSGVNSFFSKLLICIYGFIFVRLSSFPMKWTVSNTIVETKNETATTFGLIPFVMAYKNKATIPDSNDETTEYCFKFFINH